tara:strand:- start:68 stop:364 length:297 start_codon:yes stop_codon:yes gene_type:complete
MKIENDKYQENAEYWYPENLEDIKKLVKMAGVIWSYNNLLEQYLRVYKNDYLHTMKYLDSKQDLSEKNQFGESILDNIKLKYYKNGTSKHTKHILTIN